MFQMTKDPTTGRPGYMPVLEPRDVAENLIGGLATIAPNDEAPILAPGADQLLRDHIAAVVKGPTESVEIPQPDAPVGALRRFRIARVMGPAVPVFKVIALHLNDDSPLGGAHLIHPRFEIPDDWTDTRKVTELARGVLVPGGAQALADDLHTRVSRLGLEQQARIMMETLQSSAGAKYVRGGQLAAPGYERALDLVTTHFPELPTDGAVRLAQDNYRRWPTDEATVVRLVAGLLGDSRMASRYGLNQPLNRMDVRRMYRTPRRDRVSTPGEYGGSLI